MRFRGFFYNREASKSLANRTWLNEAIRFCCEKPCSLPRLIQATLPDFFGDPTKSTTDLYKSKTCHRTTTATLHQLSTQIPCYPRSRHALFCRLQPIFLWSNIYSIKEKDTTSSIISLTRFEICWEKNPASSRMMSPNDCMTKTVLTFM